MITKTIAYDIAKSKDENIIQTAIALNDAITVSAKQGNGHLHIAYSLEEDEGCLGLDTYDNCKTFIDNVDYFIRMLGEHGYDISICDLKHVNYGNEEIVEMAKPLVDKISKMVTVRWRK